MRAELFYTFCFVKHDCVYEPCQRLQPLCSQVSHPLTPGRLATIVLERMSSGYPALTQKAGKLGLCYTSIGDRTHTGPSIKENGWTKMTQKMFYKDVLLFILHYIFDICHHFLHLSFLFFYGSRLCCSSEAESGCKFLCFVCGRVVIVHVFAF